MAEEKKFLNEEMERSNHKLMVKYIALSVVIFVILILCVLAWFSSKQEANASGLTIKATADNGLQVAICEKPNNMAYTSEEEWSSFKYQQTYDSKFTSSEPLPLISGNGLRFFEPNFVKVAENYTDKLNIDVLDEAGQVEWIDVTENTNSQLKKSKYIEYKLKFRNDKKSNVFLTGDSKVTPDSSKAYKPDTYKVNTNSSEFSRNFISATARIAFLNQVTVNNKKALNLHNLWIPNDDIELNHADQVESTVTTYEKQNPQGTVKKDSGSSSGIPTGGKETNYYVWWNGEDIFRGDTPSQMVDYYNNMKDYCSPLMEKDDYYYFKMVAPETDNDYVSNRAFFVTVGNTIDIQPTGSSYEVRNKYELERKVSSSYVEAGGRTVTVEFDSNNYNLAYQQNADGGYDYIYNCERVYISPHIGTVEYYLIIEKVNDTTGNVSQIIINNNGSSGSGPSYSVEINKDENIYVPQNDDFLLISANNGSNNYGLSASEGTVSTKNIGANLSGAGIPNWTVAGVTEAGSFKLYSNEKYLSISSDASGLVLTEDSGDAGTDFYAVTRYEETINGAAQPPINFNGVILYSLTYNKFLIFNGTSFQLSDTYTTAYEHSIYKQKEKVSITPASWGIRTPLTNPRSVNENKFYYRTVDPDNATKTKKQELLRTDYILSEDLNNENAIPPQYDSEENTTKHPNFIVSIDQDDGQGFFVSDEITVRIWGEGYDREAQTPLQGGSMQVDLHFFAVEKDEE